MVLRRVKPKDDKPPKPDKPKDTPKDRPRNDPPAPGQGAITLPAGPIHAGQYGFGWEQITRWAPQAQQASAEFGVPLPRILAHIVIESGGDPDAVQRNDQNGWSYGLMQIVAYGRGWAGWHDRVIDLAGLSRSASAETVVAALLDPLTNLRVGASMLRDMQRQYGSWDAASSAFFTGTPNWNGTDTVNGTTGNQYKRTLDALIAEIDGAGTTPAPPPQPTGDVLDLLFGGKPYTISATYGQLITWSCPGCYDYFAAYGLDTQHHWAYDVSANAGEGAPLYAPFAGTVVCAGTDAGPGAWGTGCAAFPRFNNYGSPRPSGPGAGRLELLYQDGDRSLILGHVLSSRVHAGDRVQAGDLIGYEGGMNGSHVHVEGRYANGTRIGDPRRLFVAGSGADGGSSPPQEAVPYNWTAPNRNTFLVTAKSDTAAYQRADPQATVLYPIAKGETVEAIAVVPGEDKEEWFLLTNDARMPVEGTTWKVRVG